LAVRPGWLGPPEHPELDTARPGHWFGRIVAVMTDPARRERAALDVLALLPEWWAVGPTSYEPGTGRWTWTAHGRHPGRGKTPERLTGTGEDELAAMPDLAISLDERRRAEKLAAIDRRSVPHSWREPRSGPAMPRAGR
jgi:hypothetical protein